MIQVLTRYKEAVSFAPETIIGPTEQAVQTGKVTP
jgi:hypothetical protein